MKREEYTKLLSGFKREIMDAELKIQYLKFEYSKHRTAWRPGDRAQIVNNLGRHNHGVKVYIRGIDATDDGKLIFSLVKLKSDNSQGRKVICLRYDEVLKKLDV